MERPSAVTQIIARQLYWYQTGIEFAVLWELQYKITQTFFLTETDVLFTVHLSRLPSLWYRKRLMNSCYSSFNNGFTIIFISVSEVTIFFRSITKIWSHRYFVCEVYDLQVTFLFSMEFHNRISFREWWVYCLFSRMETFQETALQMLKEFRALLQQSPVPLPCNRFLQLLALNMYAIETTQLKGKWQCSFCAISFLFFNYRNQNNTHVLRLIKWGTYMPLNIT